jgi:hypothetical protein
VRVREKEREREEKGLKGFPEIRHDQNIKKQEEISEEEKLFFRNLDISSLIFQNKNDLRKISSSSNTNRIKASVSHFLSLVKFSSYNL